MQTVWPVLNPVELATGIVTLDSGMVFVPPVWEPEVIAAVVVVVAVVRPNVESQLAALEPVNVPALKDDI
jgi:hypothetical protein